MLNQLVAVHIMLEKAQREIMIHHHYLIFLLRENPHLYACKNLSCQWTFVRSDDDAGIVTVSHDKEKYIAQQKV